LDRRSDDAASPASSSSSANETALAATIPQLDGPQSRPQSAETNSKPSEWQKSGGSSIARFAAPPVAKAFKEHVTHSEAGDLEEGLREEKDGSYSEEGGVIEKKQGRRPEREKACYPERENGFATGGGRHKNSKEVDRVSTGGIVEGHSLGRAHRKESERDGPKSRRRVSGASEVFTGEKAEKRRQKPQQESLRPSQEPDTGDSDTSQRVREPIRPRTTAGIRGKKMDWGASPQERKMEMSHLAGGGPDENLDVGDSDVGGALLSRELRELRRIQEARRGLEKQRLWGGVDALREWKDANGGVRVGIQIFIVLIIFTP
jgi:hypothetical protein